MDLFICYRGWRTALRGDVETAEAIRAVLRDLRDSEDPQDKALVSAVKAFTAAARGQAAEALRDARRTLVHADAIGIRCDSLRWAWPLAARSADELRDTAATRELLALLDACQPGYLAPMLRAERGLVRARLAEGDAGQEAAAAWPRRSPICASRARPTI
jgi:hypothetical protein